MKRLNQYQCETCNTIYKVETEADVCEKTHRHVKQILSESFNSYKNNGEYPKRIVCEMDNGVKATFDFTGVTK